MYHSKVILCGVNTSKLKVLTEEEKKALMKRVREGDEDARRDMITGNLRLVLSIVQRFAGGIQTGISCRGLLLYFQQRCAAKIIQQLQLLVLFQQRHMLHLPVNIDQQAAQLTQLRQRNGAAVQAADIAPTAHQLAG